MKKRFFLFLLCISSTLFCAEKWDDPAASYRIIMKQQVPAEQGYADLRTLCLPQDPKTGFRIFDENGKPVRFHHFDAYRLLLPVQKKEMVYRIYFGYAKKQPYLRFDPKKEKIPYDFKLRQNNVSKNYPEDLEKWTDSSARTRHSRFARLLREKGKRLSQLQRSMHPHPRELLPFLKKNLAHPFSDYVRLQFEKYRKYQEEFHRERLLDCENALFANFRNRKAGYNAVRLFFTRRPFDTDRFFVTIFYGRLIVPQDGEYHFLLNTNSTRILRIGGKTVARLFGETQAADSAMIGSREEVKLPLKRGTVDFEFVYCKGAITNWAAVSIRRPGENKYSLLSEDDFAPAAPLEVLSLEKRDGGKYPIVFRKDSFALYTGKHETCCLDEFQVKGTEKFHWQLEKELLESKYRAFALKDLAKPELKLIPEDGRLPLPVIRHARNGAKGPVEPLLGMKIWAPSFLSDDEYCSADLEMFSRIPIPFYAVLNRKSNDSGLWFSERQKDAVYFPSMPMEHEDRFAQAVILKRSKRIDGAFVTKPVTVDLELGIPGLVFDRKGLLISRVADLPALHATEAGLADPSGRKVLVILHRRSLHEVRSWELLKKIRDEIELPKKILVIAEDFGAFRQHLEKRAETAGIKLEFCAWRKSAEPSGSPALNTIPKILEALEKSHADMLAVVPIHSGGRGVLGNREELNMISLILEKAQMNRNFHQIALSTPMPCREPQDLSFNENLRKLRREKGVGFIELEALFRMHCPQDAAYGSGNTAHHTLPVLKSSELAELFFRELIKK